jgi:hypothetical protein
LPPLNLLQNRRTNVLRTANTKRLRIWLALQQQKRRRHSTPQPTAPYNLSGTFEWDATDVGRADALIDFAFDQGSLPVATFEIWWKSQIGTGWVWTLLTTISSSLRGYRHPSAVGSEAWVFYKLRYVNGAVIGPFSADLEIVE